MYRSVIALSYGVSNRLDAGIGLIDGTDPPHAQQHYIFPVPYGELPGNIEYGVGPGLIRGPDRVITKLNLELDRFMVPCFENRGAIGLLRNQRIGQRPVVAWRGPVWRRSGRAPPRP